MENFITFRDNNITINKNNIANLTIENNKNSKNWFGLVASFKNGKSTVLLSSWDKKWLEKLKQEVEGKLTSSSTLVETHFKVEKQEDTNSYKITCY